MDKASIEKRLAEIEQAIQNSIANHNALLGRKAEAMYCLEEIFKHEVEASEEGGKDATNEG